ncbi:MAG: hypothetical protein KH330_06630 [Clostridiales bacterium]|nr:hypothetical protein [Clostridiales bacterium]
MIYEEESDYIMRMIKEAARVLFSLIFGKKYTQIELPKGNKFSVSGSSLDDLTELVDQGKINEAENILLENMDYENPEELAAAVLFYEYVSEKGQEFLQAHDYSLEEAAEGIKQIAEYAGYGALLGEIDL